MPWNFLQIAVGRRGDGRVEAELFEVGGEGLLADAGALLHQRLLAAVGGNFQRDVGERHDEHDDGQRPCLLVEPNGKICGCDHGRGAFSETE